MKSPLEDTIWGATYGSVAAVQAAFDRFAPDYHRAILTSGAPAGAARAILPHLDLQAQGLDLGCGSGALGVGLREQGFTGPLDGIDLSPVMLNLARDTGCYRHLHRANLLNPEETPTLPPYDFLITMGLIGDYIPYYLGLPDAVARVRSEGIIGFAVESRSTPWRALEQMAADLHLHILSETELPIVEAELVPQIYYLYVARLR